MAKLKLGPPTLGTASTHLGKESFDRSIRWRGFRSISRSRAYALDDHVLDVNRGDRRVARVAWNLRNRFHDVTVFALPPYRVLSVEGRIGGLGDEKMSVVRVRAAVSHRQTSRRVEFKRRRDFALVGKPRALGMPDARAEQIAALNHDAWNHAVEDEAVKEFLAFDLLRLGMNVRNFSDRQPHHGVHRDGSFGFEKLAGDFSFVGL